MIPVFPDSSNVGSGCCSIRFISRQRLRLMLSIATVALQNFVNFSNQRFTTASNVSLLRTCTRLLDLENVSGSNVNENDSVGIPVDLVFLLNNLSISTLVNPHTSGIYNNRRSLELWNDVVRSFISTRHHMMSLQHTAIDPMLVSEQGFEIIMTSAGIAQEEHENIISEFCFSSRSSNNQIRLDWWRSGHSSSTLTHLTYLVFLLFDVSTRNVLHVGVVYRLMSSILEKMLSLAYLGGNNLVMSAFLEVLHSVLSLTRSSIAILHGRHQEVLENSVMVASGFCRICNHRFFICSAYFNRLENIVDLWVGMNSFREIADLIEAKIRSVLNLIPNTNPCNQSLLIAFLDFFTDQIVTTFSEVPVLPVMPLRGTTAPCSLLELSLSAINVNNPHLRDSRIMELVVTSRSSYDDITTVRARRAEFIHARAVQRILSINPEEVMQRCDRCLSFIRFMFLNVDPGQIHLATWISFIRFVRSSSTLLSQYEIATRTISVLDIMRSRIENNHGNIVLLCHTSALAIMFFLQEIADINSPESTRCIFNFIFRSLTQEANAIIGQAPDIILSDVASEFIIGNRVYPPT